MQITVRLFAAYRELFGRSTLELDVPEGTTAGAVLGRLLADHPGARIPAEATKFAVNLEYADPATVLRPGDELVLLPPVSGGAEGVENV